MEGGGVWMEGRTNNSRQLEHDGPELRGREQQVDPRAFFCVAARQCGKLAQTRTGFTGGDGAQEAKDGISSSVGSSLTGWRRGTARKHCAQFATFGHSEEIRTVLTASDC